MATENHHRVMLACPDGQVIRDITSASYGDVTSDCTDLGTRQGPHCHAPSSLDMAIVWCRGKSFCWLEADRRYFGDQSCGGRTQRFRVVAQCENVV